MKLRYSILFLLAISSVIVIGCTSSGSSSTSLKCHDLDGTWSGVISDSGSIEVSELNSWEIRTTHSPFIAQYNFEMTISCESENEGWKSYKITHVKASHPIFGCDGEGCVPVQQSSMLWLSSNQGSFSVTFPNGAYIDADDWSEKVVELTPDGKIKFTIDGKNKYVSIGEKWEEREGIRRIETDNCHVMAGGRERTCMVEYINPNTIYLTKIS